MPIVLSSLRLLGIAGEKERTLKYAICYQRKGLNRPKESAEPMCQARALRDVGLWSLNIVP